MPMHTRKYRQISTYEANNSIIALHLWIWWYNKDFILQASSHTLVLYPQIQMLFKFEVSYDFKYWIFLTNYKFKNG